MRMWRHHDLKLTYVFGKFFQGLFFVIGYCWKLWDVLVLLIVLCCLVPHFWQEMAANFTEPGATPFSMDSFPDVYAGQYWLKLEGELALEHFHLEKETASSAEENPVRINVPLVAPFWESRQPVHAVVIFHMEESDVNNWLNKYQLQRKYTGCC